MLNKRSPCVFKGRYYT